MRIKCDRRNEQKRRRLLRNHLPWTIFQDYRCYFVFIHHLKLLTIEIVFILAISIILSNRYLHCDGHDKDRRRPAIAYDCLDAETEDLPLQYLLVSKYWDTCRQSLLSCLGLSLYWWSQVNIFCRENKCKKN